MEIGVTLGGRVFGLPKLTIRAEAEWRRLAKETLAPLLQAGNLAEMEVTSAADIARVVQLFGEWLEPMAALRTLVAYAPTVLAPEQEWLEEHAYSDEVIAALLKLFFVAPAPTNSGRTGAPALR